MGLGSFGAAVPREDWTSFFLNGSFAYKAGFRALGMYTFESQPQPGNRFSKQGSRFSWGAAFFRGSKKGS